MHVVALTVRSENEFPGRKGSAISDYIILIQHQELVVVAILLFNFCFHGENAHALCSRDEDMIAPPL